MKKVYFKGTVDSFIYVATDLGKLAFPWILSFVVLAKSAYISIDNL